MHLKHVSIAIHLKSSDKKKLKEGKTGQNPSNDSTLINPFRKKSPCKLVSFILPGLGRGSNDKGDVKIEIQQETIKCVCTIQNLQNFS